MIEYTPMKASTKRNDAFDIGFGRIQKYQPFIYTAVKHRGDPCAALCQQTIHLKLERADLAAVARSPVSAVDQADRQPECRAK